MLKKYWMIGMLAGILMLSTSCSVLNTEIKNNKQQLQYLSSRSQDDIMDMGPVRGGTLKLFSTVPDTLNPILTSNIFVKDFSELVFESLVGLDKNQQPVPVISDRWEVSDDGLTWTFHIRDGVTWHDNMPLTAEDVEFTCKTLLNPAVASIYKKNLEYVTTFAAIDRSHFRVILKKPYSCMAELMTFPVLPKHCYNGEDVLKSSRNLKPVGTGPYKFSSYTPKTEVKFIINDNWWKSKLEPDKNNKGPYITEVLVKIYENGRDYINAFQTRDVDLAFIESGSLNRYTGRSDLIMKKYPGKEFEFIAINHSKPVFASKAVRQAIACTVDRTEIINELLPGEAIAADIPIIPGTWLDDGNKESYNSNPAKGKELLAADGWKDNNGVLYKYINGVYTPLTFELLVNDDNPVRFKVAEKLAEQLGKVGISLQIKRMTWEDQLKSINTRKFDLALMGYKVNNIPDVSFAYTTSEIATGRNVSAYSNPSLDNLLERIMAEEDIESKKALFSSASKLIKEEVPCVGLYFRNNGILYSRRIKGTFAPHTWDKFGGISTWYIPVN